MKKTVLKILFWLLMAIIPLIAVFLIYFGVEYYHEVSLLKSRGKVGKASIMRTNIQEATEGGDTHYLYYQVEGADKITEEVVEEEIYEKYSVGSMIDVVYVPDQPHIARLKERGVSYQAAIFRVGIGLVLLVLFIGYIIQLYHRKKP